MLDSPETTPTCVQTPLQYDILNHCKDGPKGILRSSGTPGSGNGVRFFPKNRFRIITPNHSVVAGPQDTIDTIPSASGPSSFLSQLLAVTIPISPRKPPSPYQSPESVPSAPLDESWETPGQEGEVSLVASSCHSMDQSQASMLGSDFEEEPWTGTPQVHSSPLGLSTDDTEDRQLEEDFSRLELPSREMEIPADMSNLLSQNLAGPSDIGSFLMSEATAMQDTLTTPLRVHEDTCEPTVRRQISPLPSRSPKEPSTPTGTRPFRSIFADMSAEQADMSWPLIRQSSLPLDDSVAIDRATLIAKDPLDASTASPGSNMCTSGNATQFFDCASSPMSSVPSTGDSKMAYSDQIILRSSSSALMAAHSAHSSALQAELDLYRNLSQQLQAEVHERDSVLADLNLRVIEGEVWRVRVDELEMRLQSSSVVPLNIGMTASPAQPTSCPGDRITVAESDNRDLRIRLEKALSDHQALGMGSARWQEQALASEKEHDATRTRLREVQQELKNATIQAQSDSDRLAAQVAAATDREQAASGRMTIAERNIEVYQGQAELERLRANQAMSELARVTEHQQSLVMELEHERAEVRRLERATQSIESLRHNLQSEKVIRQESDHRLQSKIHELHVAEAEIDELRHALEKTRGELLSRLNAPSSESAELSKLRSESALKNLEIINLQRRKQELKEDVEMLNIALDSKQQELELIKRKFAVRGVAGCTPLTSTKIVNTPSGRAAETPAPRKGGNSRRASSMALVTPAVGIEGMQSRVLRPTYAINTQAGSAIKVDRGRKYDVQGSTKQFIAPRERLLA